MKDFFLFLGKFFKHGTAIASLAPSSPWLSRTTVRNIPWESARVVVELGAGTGPITKVIADRVHPDCRVIILERDPDFARLLRERFAHRANFDVVEGDVRDLTEILNQRGIEQVDYVVSGLPVPSFPKALQRDLFRAVKQVLAPSGTFNQITEMPWVYQRFYRRFFDEVTFVFEPRNLPPAGAYFCRGVKESF
ncbi:ornithine lipid N-methyltransferase [Singulisphaera sp. Ch08]|uniref:Ornithine lipid N-methyltransferase n=1 Tax=Singulisphaera sp. Ch08 TaxID=3120278 RepID=A0AAU7CF69_9BACT